MVKLILGARALRYSAAAGEAAAHNFVPRINAMVFEDLGSQRSLIERDLLIAADFAPGLHQQARVLVARLERWEAEYY